MERHLKLLSFLSRFWGAVQGVPVTQAVFLAPFKKYENTDLGYLYDTKKITDRGADIAAKFREWIDKPEIRERQKQEKKDFLYLQDENQAIWHIPKSKITAWAIG
jgi:hypothetical protein